MTNRLLIEARGGFRGEHYKYNPFPEDDPILNLIPVTENGGPVPGISYHGHPAGNFSTQPFQNTYGRNFDLVAVSIVRDGDARDQVWCARHHRHPRRTGR